MSANGDHVFIVVWPPFIVVRDLNHNRKYYERVRSSVLVSNISEVLFRFPGGVLSVRRTHFIQNDH